MTANLISTLQEALSGPAADKLAEYTGMSGDSLQKVTKTSVPLSLAGLAGNVTTPDAARGLLDTLRGGQVSPLDADDLTHAVSEPGALDRMSRGGEGLLGKIFGGGDIGGITGALASTLGVGKAGIGKFMPLL